MKNKRDQFITDIQQYKATKDREALNRKLELAILKGFLTQWISVVVDIPNYERDEDVEELWAILKNTLIKMKNDIITMEKKL